MLQNIQKIVIIILFLYSNIASSQNVIIDYSTFSSSDCNIFRTPVNINGISHQTTIGSPQYNTSTQAIKMNFDYFNNSGQKGTEFKISYNVKQGYKYTIKVTGRNTSSYSVRTGLKVSFGDNGGNSLCNGVSLITGTTSGTTANTSLQFQSTNFNENIWYFNLGMTSSSNHIRFATYSDFIASPQLQTIEIKRIEIIETAPTSSFVLSPSTATIPCNSTAPVTFVVSPTNVPSGSSIMYSWNYNGWTFVSQTYNSITLQPSSLTSLPSNVSVTPFIDGISQALLTSSISRGVTQNGQIDGNPNVCSTMVYSYTGLLPGQTVSWSLSNTSSGILSNSTGLTTTFSAITVYPVILTATISNSCGSTFTKTITILPGGPSLSGIVSGPTCVSFGQRASYVFSGSASNGSTDYKWSVDAPIDDSSSFSNPTNCSWKPLSLQGQNGFSFKVGCIPAIVVVRVTVNNPCLPKYAYLYVTVNATGNCSSFRVANIQQENGNFASYIVDNEESNSNNKIEDLGIDYQADIYDLNGIKVKEFKTNDYEVSDLKAGIYIIKLFYNDNFYTSKFIVN